MFVGAAHDHNNRLKTVNTHDNLKEEFNIMGNVLIC